MKEYTDEDYLEDYKNKYWVYEYYKYYEDFLNYIGWNKEQIKITNSDVNVISQLLRVDKDNDFGLILDIDCGKDERFVIYNKEYHKQIILNSIKMKLYDDKNKEIDYDTKLRFENVIISDTWPTIAVCHYRDVRTEDGYKMIKPSSFNNSKHLMIWTSVYKDDSIPDIISGAMGKPKIDLCINPEYTKFEIIFYSWTLSKDFDIDVYNKKSIEYLNKKELEPIKEKIVNERIQKSKKKTSVLSAYNIDWKKKEVVKVE